MKIKVLLIDDDRKLAALLAEAGQVNFDAAGKIGCFVA